MSLGQDIVQRIEGLPEVRAAWVGPPMAYFDVAGKRYIYRTYAMVGHTPAQVADEITAVLKYELRRHAMISEDCPLETKEASVNVVWRTDYRVSLEQGMDHRWYARSRVAFVPA